MENLNVIFPIIIPCFFVVYIKLVPTVDQSQLIVTNNYNRSSNANALNRNDRHDTYQHMMPEIHQVQTQFVLYIAKIIKLHGTV